MKKTEELKPVALLEDGWTVFDKKIEAPQETPEGFVEIGISMIWKHNIRSKRHRCPKTMQKFLRKA